jgi:micrococcal nuclease
MVYRVIEEIRGRYFENCTVVLIIIALVILLSTLLITPLAWIGLIIFLYGLYQMRQQKKGKGITKGILSKTRWFIIGGLLFSFIVAMIFVEPSKDEANDVKLKQEQKIKSEQIKKEEQKALVKKRAEDDKKAKEQAEIEAQQAKIQAEEQAKQEALKKEQEVVANLGLVAATISRVVDGDTVELSDGNKVRMIGINTPESTTSHEEYGKEASNYTTSKLQGKQVWLQKDVSETDRYGRLLRIVWLAIPTNGLDENEIRTKMFNADLVLNGYAEPSTNPPDVTYTDFFVKFGREARETDKGLWVFGENGTTKGDLDPKDVPSSSPTPPNSNNSSSTTTPEATTPAPGPSTSGDGTEIFANCTELRTKYPNGVPSTHPAYQSKMDRDHDNFACER